MLCRLPLVLGILLLPGLARAGNDAERFGPGSLGDVSSYSLHRDTSWVWADGRLERRFALGRVQREVIGENLDGSARELHLVERRSEQDLERGVQHTGHAEIRMRLGPDGLAIAALVEEAGGGERRLEQPLRVLAAKLDPGTRWAVGTHRTQGLSVRLDAHVLGYEEVEEAGESVRCLKVRYAGPVRGDLSVEGLQARVTSGTFERTAWYAAGRGEMRQVTRLEVEAVATVGEERLQFSGVETLRRLAQSPATP